MNSLAVPRRDVRLIPSPYYFGGGLAGRFARVLMNQYLGPMGWPANIAIGGFDTCSQNDLAGLQPGPRFDFLRLGFSGMPFLTEMVAGNPSWERDIDIPLLKRTGPPLTNDGTLKGPHRTEAIVFQNIPELTYQVGRVVEMCDDPSNPDIASSSMNPTYIAGLGGSGAGIVTTAGIINFLKRCSPDVSGGREYAQRLVFCGASFFLGDTRLASRCQGIQAAFLRSLNTLLLEGTRTHDHRFGGGVFPGLDSLTTSVESGVPQIPPGAFSEVVILEQDSMGTGHLTLELLEEMLAGELYWRSQLPELTNRMRGLLNDVSDTVRAREQRERTAYRFSSFGFRVMEMPPTLGQIRELVLGKKVGEAVLRAPTGVDIPAINFGRENLDGLVSGWEQEIADEGVRIPSPEALASRIITHDDHPTALAVIEEELERAEQVIPRRIEEVLGDLGRTSREVVAQFEDGLTARREFGALAGLDQELADLEEDLSRDLVPQSLPASEQLRAELRQLSTAIEQAEEPVEEEHSLWSTVTFALGALFGKGNRRREPPQVRPAVRDNARRAARMLCERAAAVRDHELALRRVAITQMVLERLAELRRDLAIQVADINEYVASADRRSRELYERGQRRNKVRMTLLPAFEVITGSVELVPSMVRGTLERLVQGQAVDQALGHATPLPVDFSSLYCESPEAKRWLVQTWTDLSVQASINTAELKGVPLSLWKFVVFPPELEADIRRELGPDERTILMPVAGISAIVIYIWMSGLPARAFQTLRQCEDALASLEPDDQKLCFMWQRYCEAPPLLIANRAESDREVACALMLSPHVPEGGSLSLALDGLDILASGPKHPFVVYKGVSAYLKVGEDVQVGRFRFARDVDGAVGFKALDEMTIMELDWDRQDPDPLLQFLQSLAAGTDGPLPGKAVLLHNATGELYEFYPDDQVLWQDRGGVWHIAVNIPGGGRFERSLRTEDLRVVLDIICSDQDYRDAITAWLRRCVKAQDFGAHDLLQKALQELDRWIFTTDHELKEKKFEELTTDEQRTGRLAVEAVKPVVERLFDLATEFSRGGRWVQSFKREPRVIPLRRTA